VISVIPAPTAVLIPGTGSDEVLVRAVFARPLAALGVDLVAPPPPPGGELARGYLTLLDTVANERAVPILVGGISFGAHLAAEWAVRNPGRCAGLLAALPAWNGPPGQAPASLAAKLSADLVARDGVKPALAASIEGVPGWLADELSRHGMDAQALQKLEALQAQVLSAQRLGTVAQDARSRLELLNARLDEAVARAVELSLSAEDATALTGLGGDVDSLVGEMESLRSALDEVGRAGRGATATGTA